MEITESDWAAVHDVADHICEVWDEPGSGIWEVRGDAHQFVYSKVMCWVGLDRAIEMADELARSRTVPTTAANGALEAPTREDRSPSVGTVRPVSVPRNYPGRGRVA